MSNFIIGFRRRTFMCETTVLVAVAQSNIITTEPNSKIVYYSVWLFGLNCMCLFPHFEYTGFTVPSSTLLCSLRWKLIYIFPPSQWALRFIANQSITNSHHFPSILYAYLKHKANATEKTKLKIPHTADKESLDRCG